MTNRSRTVAAVALLLLFVVSPAGTAVAGSLGVDAPVGAASAEVVDDPVAQADEPGGTEADEEGEEDEGGIEGAISGFIDAYGLLGLALVLVVGVGLLTGATEKLISYLTRASLRTQLSLFAMAVVFTGFEFDDTVVAFVFSAGGMEGAALGSALGTGLAITGATLAIAAVVKPFPVDLPRDYIALFVFSPLLVLPLAVTGTLTTGYAAVLVAFFVGSFAYLVVRERQRDIPVFRDTEIGKAIRGDGGTAQSDSLEPIPEDRFLGRYADSGAAWLALSVVALAGIVFGAMLLESGSEAVTETFDIGGTLLGATFLTLILTFEDIILTLEPVRRGLPEIGVGNVIGSVLFSVTGNIGIVAFFGEVSVDSSVLTLHLPAMIVVTALAGYFLLSGKLKRWHGYALGGLYLAYWVIALTVYGSAPV